MIDKKSILKKMNLEELIDLPLFEEVIVTRVKLGTNGDLYGYRSGKAWYILKGRVKLTTYFEDGREFFWESREGEWVGIADAILGTEVGYDAHAYTDAVIVEFPFRSMTESEHSTPVLIKKVIKIMAGMVKANEETALERLGYGDEMYFLKYLERNNYILRYKTLANLSELLNINMRTFQRILKRLVEKNIIIKKRGCIEVEDIKGYRSYIEDLSE